MTCKWLILLCGLRVDNPLPEVRRKKIEYLAEMKVVMTLDGEELI